VDGGDRRLQRIRPGWARSQRPLST